MASARATSAVPTVRHGVTVRHMLLAQDIVETALRTPRCTQAVALRLADMEAQAARVALARRAPPWLWGLVGVFVGLALSEWWP